MTEAIASLRPPAATESARIEHMQDIDRVRSAFIDPVEFWTSPLYRHLCDVVAEDPALVALAAHARAGQQPTFAFFGAIHALLLGGVEHELGDYYVSLRGEHARAPEGAGPALQSFADEYADEIRQILRTRLVQTNHVQRAIGLRLGLAAIADRIGNAPVHLLEVGSSAGLLLRHAEYGYRLGDRMFGNAASPVQVVCEWRGPEPAPDLDRVPRIASTTGIDLNPLDPADPADRLWLEALVWPEDRHKARQLRTALGVAAGSLVTVLTGDAIELCPQWAAGLPAGDARVVFHCATRMHVPADRRPLFDDAIASTGSEGPLYRIAIEGDGIAVTDPDGTTTVRYDVEGHLAWARSAAAVTE